MSDTTFTVDKDKLEVRITRVFAATPERMWRAFSEPEEIKQWWADTDIDTHDFRVGGTWRFVSHGQDGSEHAFRGEFKEIDEPRRIVRTFEYEPRAGHIMTESVDFEPQAGGKTLMTTVSKYENLGDLEGMVGSGMEHGSKLGLDRLAALVEAS